METLSKNIIKGQSNLVSKANENILQNIAISQIKDRHQFTKNIAHWLEDLY